MITKLKTTIWAFALLLGVASLLVISSCSEDEPDPTIAPSISYTDTDVELGTTGDIVPAMQGDLPITWSIIDDGGTADFVTIDAATGTLQVAAESVLGEYTVKVKAQNAGGAAEADAKINITISANFDPRGLNLYWKYFFNNTAGVTLLNLDLIDETLPASIEIPTGTPAGWETGAIDPTDPAFPTYFIFTGVQEALMQVPGDNMCAALTPPESGDNLLVIVNQDLTVSTVCHVDDVDGTTVEIGTSTISYVDGGYVWTIQTTLEGVPVPIVITGAQIVDSYLDPLHPHYSNPSGTGGTYKAIVGNVPQYMTPTDFNPDNYLTSIQLLDVDIVLEVLE